MPNEPILQSARRRPAEALTGYVAGYTGYRQAGGAPGLHRGLPSPYLTVILTLDDPLVMAAHPDPRQPGGRFDALVGGLHATPALITHDGRQSGVQLMFSPLGARALLGVPAGELAAIDVHAADLLGGFADELLDRVRAAPGWPERFAVLDRLLTCRLQRARESTAQAEPSAQVRQAWRRLTRHPEQDVAGLAAEVGWSRRHLAHRFGVEVGLTPKQVARVVRFDGCRRDLARRVGRGGPGPGSGRIRLAEVAAQHGYYDQSHLDREFGALAGCPPSVWLAEELPNVQVPEPGEGASWTA
jgi:AraC-like DNA-binding protein